MAVAVTSFTYVSPAAAQRSSGTEAGLSIIEAEICFRRAQSNRRKSKENSRRRRSAARVHQRPGGERLMRRHNRRPRQEDRLSGFANSVLSAGLFGLALALI